MSPAKTRAGIRVEKPAPEKLKQLKVANWPVWTKETSTFDWHYEEKEICYFLEGDVVVKTADGEFTFGKGDLVTFPKGLHCTWHVKQPVRKHYQFE